MRKLCSKWVLCLLTVNQKQHVNYSEHCLQLFQHNKKEFLHKYVTMDEIWIHHFTPESNWQSAEWTAAGESHPKRPKTQSSAGKVLAPIFWDAQGILFISYLEKGSTINNEYYIALLVCLKEEITKKTATNEKEKVLFHQDNALCHKSIATMAKLHELHFKLLLHPPYSPDLAPSDYWLFADLKKIAPGKEIWLQWRSDIGNWGIFWGQRQTVLQKRHQIVREALELVYHLWRRLCWWIKLNFV